MPSPLHDCSFCVDNLITPTTVVMDSVFGDQSSPRMSNPLGGEAMTKVLVLYYSSYGHIEQMAQAAAEGVAKVSGATAVVKRVPETVPAEIAKQMHFKLDQAAPIATVDELADYDAIIFGTPTRYGNMAAQMKTFIDMTGGLWMKGAL